MKSVKAGNKDKVIRGSVGSPAELGKSPGKQPVMLLQPEDRVLTGIRAGVRACS